MDGDLFQDDQSRESSLGDKSGDDAKEAKWAYKKFVNGQEPVERSPMSNPVIKATMMLSVAATSTFTAFVFSWIGLALLGF